MAISKLILNGEVQMDVTSNTNVAGNMLSGVIGTKNDGTSVTGNIATKTSSDLTASGATVTAPAGYYANAASKAVSTTTHPNPTAAITSSTGVVTASHTQGTGYVTGGTTTGTLSLTTQAGKTVTPTESAQTAVASYRWTTGPISVAAISSTYVGTGVAKKSSADLTASGSTVTAPAGYYSTAATKNISAGSAFPPAVTITKAPTIGVNTSGVVTASYNGSSSITPTVNAGYISQGTAGTISTTGTSTYQLTSQAAATYYPSTADQTIASQRWLVGNQTIKSVTTSNLTAENIAEGVVVKVGDSSNASRITQITGTHSGAPTYTATIIRSGSNNSYFKCYVTYNGTVYRLKDETFEFHGGDTVTFSLYNDGAAAVVVVDDTTIYSVTTTTTSTTYNYTLPNHDIDIQLNTGAYVDPYGFGVYVVSPTINIIENGKYEVGGYGYANVDVSSPVVSKTITESGTYDATLELATKLSNPYTTITYSYYQDYQFRIPITWTSLPKQNQTLTIQSFSWYLEDFNYDNDGEAIPVQNVIFTGFPIQLQRSNGNSSVVTITENYIIINRQWIDNLDDAYITEVNIQASGEIVGYNPVNVNTAAGFTVDQIATRSIAGAISGNVSRIGSYAFAGCSELTVVSFPSCTFIDTQAFAYCGLSEVNFPACKSIGNSAFQGNYSLQTVSFSSCTHIGYYAFTDCGTLESISFPVCSYIYSSAFNNCTALQAVSFPLVLNIYNSVFAYCTSLRSINLPKCSQIGSYAFQGCYSLQVASFPSCTNILSSAFYRCYNLLSLYLLGSNVASLTNTYVFYSTPISNYTTSTGGVYGKIYVPASLYNSYITATNWSVYSARIVSV